MLVKLPTLVLQVPESREGAAKRAPNTSRKPEHATRAGSIGTSPMRTRGHRCWPNTGPKTPNNRVVGPELVAGL
eukprot:1222612-Lingulodinium_polyedra.AAC.1